MSNPTGLLNCPFCGNKPTMVEWTASAPEIRCDPCGIIMDGLRDEVIAAWNRRAQPEGKAITLLKDAARAWNNEASSELDATMERIESFLLGSSAQPEGEAPQASLLIGTAKRMRDLAAGKITGEIKQFEYSLAADRIEELEGVAEHLKAAPALIAVAGVHPRLVADLEAEFGATAAAATLSPLCEAVDVLRRAAQYFEDFYANAKVRGCASAYEHVRVLGLDARAALAAQQAAAPRTDLSKRIRAAATADVTLAQAKLLIGAAEEIERAQQAAAPGALPDQAQFEAQAKYQGATDFTLVHPDFARCNNGWGPATYRDPMTELAWRVWANKRLAPGAPADCSGTPSSCPDNEGYGCHCSAPGTPEAPKPTFPISDDEMAALRRFWECATDGEGYDVEKSMMQRLAEMGLVHRKSGAYYMATEFGLYVLGEYTMERAAQLDGGQEGSKVENVKSCWSCGRVYTNAQRANADGHCPHCSAEVVQDGSESNG